MHFDHVGNANLFTRATWILHRDELAWALADPPHVSMVPELFSGYTSANKKLIDGDFDVFGAGTVRILKAPATRRAAPRSMFRRSTRCSWVTRWRPTPSPPAREARRSRPFPPTQRRQWSRWTG